MPRYGCCSQAFVFPRSRVADIVEWLDEKNKGYADSLMEDYGNENGEIRWAVTPSLFQHVGASSSKFDKDGTRRMATSIWNFLFEEYDPVSLQIEHENAINGTSLGSKEEGS